MTDDRRVSAAVRAEWTTTNERYFTGSMTDADWTGWQNRRLRSVVTHVQERSPFYRERLAGVRPEQVTTATLAGLPVTSKADLRTAMQDALSGPMSDAAIYYETTGTTGPSTPCPRGPLDIFTSNAHVTESWRRLFRARFGDRLPVIGLMGPSELYAFGDTFADVAQDVGAAHVKIWPESPRVGFRKALQLMRDLGVEVVVCAPALCLNLAKAALHNGYDPATDFSVSQFLTLGEICTPEFRRNVASIWGAEVTPTLYGSQEALAIATGCVEGNLHLSRTNYVAEVLDDDGRSRGQRGSGELCLTMLAEGIKPLIRYRTGDQVQISDAGNCACGHPGDVVDVRGRVDDRIDIGTTALDPAQLESLVLGGVQGCLGYQIVIEEDGALAVALELVLGPYTARAVSTTVADRVRAATGAEVRVSVETDLDPIVNTGAYVSWKAARVQDRRSPEDRLAATARRFAEAHLVTS
jgi:benzoxazolinate moiety biosynthesis protein SgcD5